MSTIKKIVFHRDADGEIVGMHVTEEMTPEELRKTFPETYARWAKQQYFTPST